MYTAYFKHKKHGHVITHHSLLKLPTTHHNNWEETKEPVTHRIVADNETLSQDDNTPLYLSLTEMAAEAIFDSSDNNSVDVSSSDNSSFGGFDGGDFGGGGSSDSY